GARVRRRGADRAGVEDDLGGGRPLEPGDHAQARGLPTTARTEQGEELTAPDLERRIVDGANVAEELRDVPELQVEVARGVHDWGGARCDSTRNSGVSSAPRRFNRTPALQGMYEPPLTCTVWPVM